MRVPLSVCNYQLPTIEMPQCAERNKVNFAQGQRDIVADEKRKLGADKRARIGSVQGNDFLAGLCGKIGEGPRRAMKLWKITPGGPRTSSLASA